MILSEDLVLQGLEQIRQAQVAFNETTKDAIERVKVAEQKNITTIKTIQGWIVHARYNMNTSSKDDRMSICENLIATIDAYCKEHLPAEKKRR